MKLIKPKFGKPFIELENEQDLKMFELDKDKEIERLKNGCEELEQQIDDLHKLETTITNENERLNNIIDKAIEYIEDIQKHPSYCDTWSTTAPHDIICILKGSDKE